MSLGAAGASQRTTVLCSISIYYIGTTKRTRRAAGRRPPLWLCGLWVLWLVHNLHLHLPGCIWSAVWLLSAICYLLSALSTIHSLFVHMCDAFFSFSFFEFGFLSRPVTTTHRKPHPTASAGLRCARSRADADLLLPPLTAADVGVGEWRLFLFFFFLLCF